MPSAAKNPDINKPWIDNYPPLKAWLIKHDARCNWQLFTAERGNKIEESFADAEARLGLTAKPTADQQQRADTSDVPVGVIMAEDARA